MSLLYPSHTYYPSLFTRFDWPAGPGPVTAAFSSPDRQEKIAAHTICYRPTVEKFFFFSCLEKGNTDTRIESVNHVYLLLVSNEPTVTLTTLSTAQHTPTMFFTRLTTQKTFLRGIRFNSSSAAAAKKSLGEKFSAFTTQSIYWGKVFAEVSKQVYSKEGLAPPALKDFESVYKQLYKCALDAAKQPELFVSSAQKSFQAVNKDAVIKYGSYAVQLFGLFALGEIVGRRQVFGYPEFGEAKHH